MSSFVKDHPILTAVFGLAVFAISTVPQWLGAVWPLFTDKTIPEWVAERKWPMLTEKISLIVTIAFGVLIVGLFAVILFQNSGKKGWSEERAPVINKTFTAQEVEIDGKSFRDCTFDGVTWIYRGTAPWEFINCTFVKGKDCYMKVLHRPTNAYLDIFQKMQAAPFLKYVRLGIQDPSGKTTWMSEYSRQPTTQPTDNPNLPSGKSPQSTKRDP